MWLSDRDVPHCPDQSEASQSGSDQWEALGVSPCDCIKYCEKWQSWDWTYYCTSSRARAYTVLTFILNRTFILSLSLWLYIVTMSVWITKCTRVSVVWCQCLCFDTPGVKLCHILMNLAIIRGEASDDQASLHWTCDDSDAAWTGTRISIVRSS